MTRSKAIELIKKYINVQPRNTKLFLNWLGITKNGFNYLIDQHRNKNLWFRNENWEWEFKWEVLDNLINNDEYKLEQLKPFADFKLTDQQFTTDSNEEYILIGKGSD